MRIFLSIYSVLVLLMAPIVAGLFLFFPRGRYRCLERFGIWRIPEGPITWFHAASLGEMNGLLPLLSAWKKRFPSERILVTSTSQSGLQRAAGHADYLRLLPFDAFPFLRRALKGLQVNRFIFGEKEFWPAVLWLLQTRKVSCHLVNGVLNEAGQRGYQMLFFFFPFLREVSRSISSTDTSTMGHFLALGFSADRVRVCGNMKYDRPLKFTPFESRALKERLFPNSKYICTLASIHPGEEQAWFDALPLLLETFPEVSFVIAPRHEERFRSLASELEKRAVQFVRLSTQGQDYVSRVLFVDTIGQLESFFAVSSFCFLGGTFVPLGGHNPLEPAAYGNFVIVGPHIQKISALISKLETEKACMVLQRPDDVGPAITRILKAPDEFERRGQGAKTVWLEMQGASEKTLDHILGSDYD